MSENGEEEPGEKRRGEEWLLGRSEVSRCLTGRCCQIIFRLLSDYFQVVVRLSDYQNILSGCSAGQRAVGVWPLTVGIACQNYQNGLGSTVYQSLYRGY